MAGFDDRHVAVHINVNPRWLESHPDADRFQVVEDVLEALIRIHGDEGFIERYYLDWKS